ncbi:hypothetical protein BJ322DRAFT_1020732 [Thelephora terrestris]|uniref:Uncharacterized protein n=1 Tax=Thelephora terrestris TaxID=56493 RepID=A0A9P6HDV8_9AGAM|nr:hypothetical protein BJ322DRAFT_1020732 [Thelephora terrestris]
MYLNSFRLEIDSGSFFATTRTTHVWRCHLGLGRHTRKPQEEKVLTAVAEREKSGQRYEPFGKRKNRALPVSLYRQTRAQEYHQGQQIIRRGCKHQLGIAPRTVIVDATLGPERWFLPGRSRGMPLGPQTKLKMTCSAVVSKGAEDGSNGVGAGVMRNYYRGERQGSGETGRTSLSSSSASPPSRLLFSVPRTLLLDWARSCGSVTLRMPSDLPLSSPGLTDKFKPPLGRGANILGNYMHKSLKARHGLNCSESIRVLPLKTLISSPLNRPVPLGRLGLSRCCAEDNFALSSLLDVDILHPRKPEKIIYQNSIALHFSAPRRSYSVFPWFPPFQTTAFPRSDDV